jgi:formylglycine-generating enzyme required for sulfatase activity
MIYLAALLLVGAVSTMTAGAQGSGKPTLAVFVVGNMDNTLVSPLAAQLGANLTSGGRYTLTSVNTANKLAELQVAYNAGGGSSIDRNALAAWGRKAGISAICLVVDDVKGSDHMFYAHLIDAKDSKVSGKGSYVRTGVGSGELPRVALALAKQLEGSGRRPSAPAPARSYPAELDIEMVFVEGGTFQIGCDSVRDGTCNAADLPTRTVQLSSFYIGKYEVTIAQWKAVMGSVPSGADVSDDQLAVQRVSRDNAATFLTRLNTRTGKNYRLPTEAEWEYAARGCKKGLCDNYRYSGSNNIDEVAWHSGNADSRTHIVGQKKPNALGIYDMTGNVWEWIHECWDSNYYKNRLTSGTNVDPMYEGPCPTNTTYGTFYPHRGGSWNETVVNHRLTRRAAYPSTYTYPYNGIRVMLPAQ